MSDALETKEDAIIELTNVVVVGSAHGKGAVTPDSIGKSTSLDFDDDLSPQSVLDDMMEDFSLTQKQAPTASQSTDSLDLNSLNSLLEDLNIDTRPPSSPPQDNVDDSFINDIMTENESMEEVAEVLQENSELCQEPVAKQAIPEDLDDLFDAAVPKLDEPIEYANKEDDSENLDDLHDLPFLDDAMDMENQEEQNVAKESSLLEDLEGLSLDDEPTPVQTPTNNDLDELFDNVTANDDVDSNNETNNATVLSDDDTDIMDEEIELEEINDIVNEDTNDSLVDEDDINAIVSFDDLDSQKPSPSNEGDIVSEARNELDSIASAKEELEEEVQNFAPIDTPLPHETVQVVSSEWQDSVDKRLNDLEQSLNRFSDKLDVLLEEHRAKNEHDALVHAFDKRILNMETRLFKYEELYAEQKMINDQLLAIVDASEKEKIASEEKEKSIGETLQTSYNEIKSELTQTQSTLSQAQAELTQANSTLSQTQSELSQVLSEITQTKSELTQAQEEIVQAKSEIAQAQEELDKANTRFENLENNMEKEIARATAKVLKEEIIPLLTEGDE